MHKIFFVPTPYVTISFHSKMWFLGSYLPTFLPDVTLFTLFLFWSLPLFEIYVRSFLNRTLEHDQTILTLLWPVNERTEMKLKIYLSEAWMCSEFGYQCPMLDKKGLRCVMIIATFLLVLLTNCESFKDRKYCLFYLLLNLVPFP